MKVLLTGTMPDGTHIRIEDWHENYSFVPIASTLASYPKSKVSCEGSFSPKGNETYRFAFNFTSKEEALQAFHDLTTGRKGLVDFKSVIDDPKYTNCL